MRIAGDRTVSQCDERIAWVEGERRETPVVANGFGFELVPTRTALRRERRSFDSVKHA